MSTEPLQVVILAAGEGKRMRSRLPKVLHPLGGRPMLQHVLDAARRLSPSRLAVVIGHGGESVAARLDAPDVAWVLQERQLGTGHAVVQALPKLEKRGVVLVLYGDVPRIATGTLRSLVDAAAENQLAILTQEVDDPKGYGRIVRDASGRVTRIVEERDATEAERAIREVNTGIVAAPFAKLEAWLAGLGNANRQGEYYLTDIVAAAVAGEFPVAVRRPQSDSECLGVNSRRELARLERLLQMDRARALLDEGVTLADPARIDVRGELSCGRDVAIDVNCIFEGKVSLGDGVKVGANCILRDVTVGAGTEIRPFSLLEESSVGENARIGPYARLRPGTELAADVHIGNFCEVKASAIGQGSKVNHLSYIGDASIGRDVNVGAGTITCNFDGAAKHRTVIGDDVHIGSDVQLVAPVTIGKGATIGAGATITRDAPAGELSVTEKKQVTKPGWKRPKKK
ncbi:MAG: bifunctional UDP-N-acetylglucosamine diphosphorylase/glucosamine-1-phosphate N-acetyltransferase GlmU [Betaproteobacteria bacterium]|nr:bifunctional UDP-N-acetylglucosamine diphosphorylase/glucosamine-1-phosphate N-acetyltransferase GlmU [Betaproteobacteria bacterium]